MKGKFFFGILVFQLFVLVAFAQKASPELNMKYSEIKWMSFEEAVKKSNQEPRKLLIDVYTNWCGWCKKMDATTYQDKDIIDYINKKYYPVRFNAEQHDS